MQQGSAIGENPKVALEAAIELALSASRIFATCT